MNGLSLTTGSLAARLTQFEYLANIWLRKFTVNNYFLVAALKSFRNGIVYGARIRAPHAFVMLAIFGNGTILARLITMLKMTIQHAWNLGRFALSYKLMMSFLRQRFLLARPNQQLIGNYKHWHPFVAASIVGYFVFGKENAINTQINLYLLSRIIYGLAKLGVRRRLFPKTYLAIFPWFAALVWGTVLWLFENHEDVLQNSLRSSMTYLYHDSNYWTNIALTGLLLRQDEKFFRL